MSKKFLTNKHLNNNDEIKDSNSDFIQFIDALADNLCQLTALLIFINPICQIFQLFFYYYVGYDILSINFAVYLKIIIALYWASWLIIIIADYFLENYYFIFYLYLIFQALAIILTYPIFGMAVFKLICSSLFLTIVS